jgi:TRAP-type C4-dicarboxylate transport system permease small subunit
MPFGQQGREHPNGTTVLVLGILSLVVCGLLGPFAWSMGSKALREIEANPGVPWNNRGNITAGRICGIVGTVLLVLQVLVLLAVLTVVVSTSS